MKMFNVVAVFGFGLMLAVSPSARADSISFNTLYYENGASVPLTDQITVTVTTTEGSAGDWTEATVTFAPAAGSTVNSIDAPVYINVNPIGGTITCTSNDGGCTAAGGGNNMGRMSFGTGAAHESSVTITLTSLESYWESAASVLTPTCPNNKSVPSCVNGYQDGSENDGASGYNPTIFSHGLEAEVEGANPQFGGYYAPTPPIAPEPGSFFLLGTGMLGLATFIYRRRSIA
ncbi:MAG: PEP-CTERM sorting domain-containing protein [Terracidiphilus sp.]